MTVTISLNAEAINNLDLSPAQQVIDKLLQDNSNTAYEQQLSFDIDYPRDPSDPRELSEIPEIRLWFVRLDVHYPWLPLIIDGKSGELYRYIAMLVPHQFSRAEGIQYNPEALEILVMEKIFAIAMWLKSRNTSSTSRLKLFSQALGYEIDDSFFALLS